MKPDRAVPRVGVGVLVFRDGHVLLGERRGAHGAGTWAPPGGHLEYGESVETCALRELEEETGLTGGQVAAGPYTNDLFEAEGLHYVTLFVVVTDVTGEPVVREPAKCVRWEWFRWSAPPSPLFAPLHSLRRQGYAPPDMADAEIECIVPILRVTSLAESLRYYREVLGFQPDWGGEDGSGMASVSRAGRSIMLCEGDQGQAGTWIWIGVDDVDRLHAEFLRNGARIQQPPTNQPWAYEMQVIDPDGHVLRFGSEPRATPSSPPASGSADSSAAGRTSDRS